MERGYKDGVAHIITQTRTIGANQFSDLHIDEKANTSSTELLPISQVRTGKLSYPCISQSTNGSATIQFPVGVAMGNDYVDAILTYRQPRVHLPHGPDVYPSERGVCLPNVAEYEQPAPCLRTLNWYAQWVRATFGKSPLVVFKVPSSADGLLGPAGGDGYPESFRILRRVEF